MNSIKVQLGRRSYPIHIGPDDLKSLPKLLLTECLGKNLFVIYDVQVHALYRQRLHRLMTSRGRRVIEFVLPRGEQAKKQATVNVLRDFLLEHRATRSDFVLAVGGGVTSDIAGFVAATVLRGIRWGIVSTSLLGMVDAAIGGKVGVNHPRGKNLIGTFYQPRFVVSDTSLLATLPTRELLSGMGEVLKYAGLIGGDLLRAAGRLSALDDASDASGAIRLVLPSARYKARLTARDERDLSVRQVLNLGHTVGHGIEHTITKNRLRHGEAVILGLYVAVDLSKHQKGCNRTALDAYGSIVSRFLRSVPYRKIDSDAVWDAMAFDKKRIGNKLRFVLLSAPGKPYLSENVTSRAAKAALHRMLAVFADEGGRDA